MNDNIGIIVTARVKSSRVPEKVLQEIKGKKTIEILLDHIIQDKYDVVLAIPESKDCDILEKVAYDKGIKCYRGEDDSPMHRLLECAKENDFEHVVRITADDIFIDQQLMRNQINFHVNGGHDYTYMKRCPEGIAGEVIRTESLQKAVDRIGDKTIEFVSYYLKDKGFKVKEYFPFREYQYSFRLTLDYPEDLLLIKDIYNGLPEPIGTLDIINYLKRHKGLLKINHMPKVTVYTCNYNTADFIIQCAESVLNQVFDDWEFIILDDKSSDESANRLLEWYGNVDYTTQKKIKIIRNDTNMELASCCNKVLEMARGKYILRIDSDDTLEDTALQEMVDEMEADNVQCILSGYNKIDTGGKLIETIEKNHFHAGGALLQRWAVNEVKFRDGVKYFEGAIFFDEFTKHYKYKFIKKALWNYRQREGQKSSADNIKERQEFKKDNDVEFKQSTQTSSEVK